jgi:hypothetical protein
MISNPSLARRMRRIEKCDAEIDAAIAKIEAVNTELKARLATIEASHTELTKRLTAVETKDAGRALQRDAATE